MTDAEANAFLAQLFGMFSTGESVPVENKRVEVGNFCNKCEEALEENTMITSQTTSRKVFYCKNNRCKRFGLLTVVTKKTKEI